MYRLALIMVGLFCAQVANAQVSDARYQEALDTIHQYALDMTNVVPCLYVAFSFPEGSAQFVERDWGKDATEKTLEMFQKGGASLGQIATLRRVYDNFYKPNWNVLDIREFSRTCYPAIFASFTLSGISAPLILRQPFRYTSKH